MKVQAGQYPSQLQIQEQYLKQDSKLQADKLQAGMSFQEILNSRINNKTTELKFSKHATGRLTDRNIELSGEQLERLTQGTQRAGEKGIRESLVLVDQLAFIVSVPNNTVITALDQNEAAENVFTNIDGAVIA